jgi:hypothetical protein
MEYDDEDDEEYVLERPSKRPPLVFLPAHPEKSHSSIGITHSLTKPPMFSWGVTLNPEKEFEFSFPEKESFPNNQRSNPDDSTWTRTIVEKLTLHAHNKAVKNHDKTTHLIWSNSDIDSIRSVSYDKAAQKKSDRIKDALNKEFLRPRSNIGFFKYRTTIIPLPIAE